MTKFFVLKSFSTCVVATFFRQDVDFSSFFSLFSIPQKDPQNGLKMGLRAGHSGSIKMIIDKHTCEVASSSAYVHPNYFRCSFVLFCSRMLDLDFLGSLGIKSTITFMSLGF
jgi:hypothetical protein